MLISDSETDKAGAALDVHTGIGDDPNDRSGLVHLFEHMLFLGIEQFRKSGEYQSLIRQHECIVLLLAVTTPQSPD